MNDFRKAIRCFTSIMLRRNYVYSDDQYTFILGTSQDVVKGINAITDLAYDEVKKNIVLEEAKRILNATA